MVISAIAIVAYSNASAQDSGVDGQPKIQYLQPFKFYQIPKDAGDINAAIVEMIKRCEECMEVENFDWLRKPSPFGFPSTDQCKIDMELTNLSISLGNIIDKIHKKHGWSTEELKSNQPRNCDLKVLKYRIDKSLQILDIALQ